MCNAPIPEGYDKSKLDKFERKAIERTEFFNKWEFAYKNEHATKTATIATVVSSSPLALLAWSVPLSSSHRVSSHTRIALLHCRMS